MRLVITVDVLSNRYFPQYGISYSPLKAIELMLEGEITRPDGIMIPMGIAKRLLHNHVTREWNYSTLVCGTVPCKQIMEPIVYVDFMPSLENISIYVYNLLYPMYRDRYNLKLSYVKAISEKGYAMHMGPPDAYCSASYKPISN